MRFRAEQHLRRASEIRGVREQGRRVDSRRCEEEGQEHEDQPASEQRPDGNRQGPLAVPDKRPRRPLRVEAGAAARGGG